MGGTGKAHMPLGWLAFVMRRVDLMAVGMRAPLALCVDGHDHSPESPPHKV